MKKTKKLLAGLLSFAMLASFVPTAMADETPEWESGEGYLFYETFDNDTYHSNFDVATSAAARWSNDIDESGRMVYTANSECTTTANPLGQNLYTLPTTGKYEVGITFYLDDVSAGQFRFRPATNAFMPNIWYFGNKAAHCVGGGNGYANDPPIDPTQPIKLVFRVDQDLKKVSSTTTYTKKGETAETTTQSTKIASSGNNIVFDAIDASGLTGSFALDNFYIIELDIPTYKVTFKDTDGNPLSVTGASLVDGEYIKYVVEGEIDGGLPTAFKAGYEFDAWYIDQECTTEYVEGSIADGDFTLYANFTGDGTLAYPDSTLPTKDGYLFYEDFDDITYYNLFQVTDTTGRWTNKVVDGQMVYTAVDGLTAANPVSVPRNIYQMPTGYKYEVGVTLDLSSITYANFNMYAGTNQNTNMPVVIYNNGYKLGGGNGFSDNPVDVTKPVKMVFFVDFESDTKTTQSYITYTPSGATEEATISSNVMSATTSQYASFAIYDKSAVGSIAIDDFYVKYAEKGAEVTFVWGDTDAEKTTASATLGAVTIPADPTKTGYTFKGWSYTEGSDVADFVNSGIEEAVTVYAVWQEEYKLTFKNGDETVEESYTVDYVGTTPTAVPEAPTGKLFAGWYDEAGNRFEESTMHTGDTVYTARFTDNFTVSFYINKEDTEAYAIATGTTGSITMPTDPTNSPYTFAGWVTASGTLFTGLDLSEADEKNALSVYASWSAYVYEERFDDDYNAAAYDTTDDGWQNTIKTAKDGNKYMSYTQKDGVTSDNNAVLFNTKDKWNTANVFKYTTMLIEPNVDYETGYSFGMNNMNTVASGWFTSLRLIIEGNCIDISNWTLYNGVLTLAKGSKALTSTDADGNDKTLTIKASEVDGLINMKSFFNIDGATSTVRHLVTYKNTSGETVQDEVYFTFTTMYTGDTSKLSGYGGSLVQLGGGTVNANSEFIIDDIYVKYAPAEDKNVNVSFVDPEGTYTFEDVTATDGIVALPEVPEAHMVVGWYFDEACTIPYSNNITAENNTLYLKKVVQYTITLHTNTNDGDQKFFTTGSMADFGAYPSPSGAKFAGWYTDAKLTNAYEWSAEDTIDENFELWAKWEERIFTEDFEDVDTIPSGYYSPEMTSTDVANVWYSYASAEDDEDGTSDDNMTYFLLEDYSTPTHYMFNNTITDPTAYPLDRNTTYEMGYKMSINNLFLYAQKMMGVRLIDSRGQNYLENNNILGWYGNGNTIHLNGYTSEEDAVAGTNFTYTLVKLTTADIDGMIDVRIIFNINGDSEASDNYTKNGLAKAIIEYKTTDGEMHRDTIYQTFKTAASWNSAGYGDYGVCAFGGTELWASQAKQTSTDGAYVEIDDVYFKAINDADEEIDVTFVTDRGELTFTEGAAVYGEVTEFPTVTDETMGIQGWYLDEAHTVPYNKNATSVYNVLYAKTTVQYTVTMKFGDDRYADVVEYTITGNLSELSFYNNPKHQAGVRFNGWYTDAAYNVPYTPPANGIITSDITLYADWADYLFMVDFENDTDQEYDSYFESPLATAGDQRWSSKVVEAEDGSHYMEYTVNPDATVVDGNQYLMNANIAGKIILDRNTTYEAGFKVDPSNYKGRITQFQLIKAANQADNRGRDIDGINDNSYHGPITIAGTAVNVDEVDGFIDVKILFAMNESTETGDNSSNNWSTNATGTRYVTYTKLDGTVVSYSEDFTFESRTNSNDSFAIDALGAMFIKEHIEQDRVTSEMTFRIDDIYVRPAQSPYIMTYDATGGSFANGEDTMSFDIGINGIVRLPNDPTREGYAFAGWFVDEELTVKYTPSGWFADQTVYARWQADPQATITVPTGKADVKPTITVDFDSEMLADTVNKDNIQIMSGDTVLDSKVYEIAVSQDKYFNTKVTITFNTTLDYDTEYTVVVKKEASNTKGMMTEDVSASFTTGKLMLRLDNLTVTSDDGENITAVTAGQNMNVKFNIFRADALN